MADAKEGYQNGVVGNMAGWYDDWSWFGIASSKAFDPDYVEFFGDDLELFRNYSLDTWGLINEGDFETLVNRIPESKWKKGRITKEKFIVRNKFHKGTPNSWTHLEPESAPRHYDYEYFSKLENWAVPRFLGGCWQYDFSSQPFPEGDGAGSDNPNPQYQSLGPFQLTLMTGLYLVFACRLAWAARLKETGQLSGLGLERLESYDVYKGYATSAVHFLQAWFDVPDGENSLFKTFDTNNTEGYMVRERMPSYAKNQSGEYPNLEYYSSNRYWGGDQGLILGGLMNYVLLLDAENSTDPLKEKLREQANKIFNGALNNLVGGSNDPVNNVVLPYKPLYGDAIFSMDPGDYASGLGVFWRYILYTCRMDSTFKRQANVIAKASGNVVVNSAQEDTPWGNSIFNPFNNLAPTLSAYYILDL